MNNKLEISWEEPRVNGKKIKVTTDQITDEEWKEINEELKYGYSIEEDFANWYNPYFTNPIPKIYNIFEKYFNCKPYKYKVVNNIDYTPYPMIIKLNNQDVNINVDDMEDEDDMEEEEDED